MGLVKFISIRIVLGRNKSCDVLISALDKLIPAHSMVLAAYSQHLDQMFTESSVEHMAINLKEFKLEIIFLILEYLYTTELTLNDGVVEQVTINMIMYYAHELLHH